MLQFLGALFDKLATDAGLADPHTLGHLWDHPAVVAGGDVMHQNLQMGFSISLMLRGFYTEYGWSQRFALTSFGITARHLWIFFDYDERQTHRGNAANVFC
jgi:hypothetical protein